MTELAPGLFVSDMVPEGQAFRLDLETIGVGYGYGIAINPSTWGRLTPAQQEKLLDDYVRHSAAAGTRALERFLQDTNARLGELR